jgi:general secretion pathway protein I
VNARGFTLLEVLVALAILGVAVVASIQGFAGGLRLLKLAGDHQEAMLVADQKLREVVAPEESRDEGTESRFQWWRTVERVPTPELAGLAQPTPWTVYKIEVHVRWDERREIHLATLRTVTNLAESQLIETGTTPPGTTQPGTSGPTPATGRTGTTGSSSSQRTTPPTTGERRR